MLNAARLWPLPLIAGGTRKRILRRRLSRIARDGARVHSLQPYGFANFTTSDVLIWDHIFFIVDDFFAHCSRCLGKTTVGIHRCMLPSSPSSGAENAFFAAFLRNFERGLLQQYRRSSPKRLRNCQAKLASTVCHRRYRHTFVAGNKPFWKCS